MEDSNEKVLLRKDYCNGGTVKDLEYKDILK